MITIINFIFILVFASLAFSEEPYSLEKIVVKTAGSDSKVLDSMSKNYFVQTLSAAQILENNLNSLVDILDYVGGLDLRYRGSQKFTKRSLGLVSTASVFIGLVFAVIFYIVLVSGFTLIGSIGLVMSLTMAFFEALPIPPMNGKDIYDWSKVLWVVLFMATFALYVLCLLLI